MGSLNYAEKLIDTVDIPRNSLIMYTTMIKAYANFGNPKEAFVFYSRMLCDQNHVFPNDFTFTYICLLKKHLKNHKTWVDSQPQTALGRLGLSLRGQDLSQVKISKRGGWKRRTRAMGRFGGGHLMVWQAILVNFSCCRNSVHAPNDLSGLRNNSKQYIRKNNRRQKPLESCLWLGVGLLNHESTGLDAWRKKNSNFLDCLVNSK